MRFIVALLCAILLWPAGLVEAADNGIADVAPVIPATWLVKKISVEEAEAEHPGVRDNGRHNLPSSPDRSVSAMPNGKP